MGSFEAFDTFYAETRERLLLEAYALTGDLPASRTAVRDAFSVARHHWSKVSRLDDPEARVRPHAHSRALHRHTARPRHRDKTVDANVRATLEALAKLSSHERKALVLTSLSPLSLTDIAREVGLPRADTERAAERDLPLRGGPSRQEHRCPPSARRFAGPAHRHHPAPEHDHPPCGHRTSPYTHADRLCGGHRRPARLGHRRRLGWLRAEARSTGESALPGITVRPASAGAAPALEDTTLLGAPQVERYGRGLSWSERETSDNPAGSGPVMPCQQTLRGPGRRRRADALLHRHGRGGEEDPQGQGQEGAHRAPNRHREARHRRPLRRALRRRGPGAGGLRDHPRVVRRLPRPACPAAVHRRGLAGG
ncbi:hypothetical protein [Nocardioides sp. B-3]|uniref:hypothetical protein n=1 Tax=Nocardioides sp. B-3 TaxID=2895565 RepID=UPI002152BAE0|nr:hypothetical protein [Nocardioides sp. B-3]UUZ57991.1 hypothetical protein LP418_16855 [Nocardioides sp. B-3]